MTNNIANNFAHASLSKKRELTIKASRFFIEAVRAILNSRGIPTKASLMTTPKTYSKGEVEFGFQLNFLEENGQEKKYLEILWDCKTHLEDPDQPNLYDARQGFCDVIIQNHQTETGICLWYGKFINTDNLFKGFLEHIFPGDSSSKDDARKELETHLGYAALSSPSPSPS